MAGAEQMSVGFTDGVVAAGPIVNAEALPRHRVVGVEVDVQPVLRRDQQLRALEKVYYDAFIDFLIADY